MITITKYNGWAWEEAEDHSEYLSFGIKTKKDEHFESIGDRVFIGEDVMEISADDWDENKDEVESYFSKGEFEKLEKYIERYN